MIVYSGLNYRREVYKWNFAKNNAEFQRTVLGLRAIGGTTNTKWSLLTFYSTCSFFRWIIQSGMSCTKLSATNSHIRLGCQIRLDLDSLISCNSFFHSRTSTIIFPCNRFFLMKRWNRHMGTSHLCLLERRYVDSVTKIENANFWTVWTRNGIAHYSRSKFSEGQSKLM